MDGGAWWAAVHGVAKNQARLSDFTFTLHFHALEKEKKQAHLINPIKWLLFIVPNLQVRTMGLREAKGYN